MFCDNRLRDSLVCLKELNCFHRVRYLSKNLVDCSDQIRSNLASPQELNPKSETNVRKEWPLDS